MKNLKIDLVQILTLGALGAIALFILSFVDVERKVSGTSEVMFGSEAMPQGGVVLPVVWGDLGVKMVEAGVVDPERFLSLYENNPVLKDEASKMLYGNGDGNLKITKENSGVVLNLLWAFGLSNKNRVLEEGPMRQYGDPGIFASTGGWTLAKGEAMDHYSSHSFVVLTEDEQRLVEEVAKNIYRPCCNNPTHFPDCNHGMAMLGLLELMAAAGVSEIEMYRVALQVNSYWFPDTYLTIAKYFESKGISWDKVNPKEVLGYAYSSASGYREILKQVSPSDNQSGGSCGV